MERIGYYPAPDVEFRVKVRRWWDVLFTTIGLSVACRTGNLEFDRTFYLVADQAPLCRTLKECRTTQEAMLRIYRECEVNGLRFRQLRIRRQRVWVEVVAKKHRAGSRLSAPVMAFIPLLRQLSEAMESELPEAARGPKDSLAWKAVMIVSISSAMLITGFLYLHQRIFLPLPGPIRASEMVSLSIITGVIVFALLATLTIVWLGRTSRTHLVLTELALAGLIGAAMASYGLLRDINMSFDRSPALEHPVEVRDKTAERGRGYTLHYLQLSGWDGPQEKRGIRVDRWLYHSVRAGDQLLLEEYPGRLGVPWIRLDTDRSEVAQSP
ncbi:hypothetical protein [Thioalkalivibrio sp. ALM2T]|uniref:hypothetical protein n=1 Tax=Thioalkalivibrio sp. ALM2T TaxID=1158184 RepID=UPI000375A36C|nr:hypothetical protein [Thioalkalivibrio sp. ALM2T]